MPELHSNFQQFLDSDIVVIVEVPIMFPSCYNNDFMDVLNFLNLSKILFVPRQ